MSKKLVKEAFEIFKNMDPEDQELALHFVENTLLGKRKENEVIKKMAGYHK